ncbi:hypothetical protein vBPFY1MI_165 [Pseudomonas phage vB_PF_Y1-MI]|nr:hypothetical protein vBPFY1MI_165 [Pseudomonas phage vB_PF_Y1-MI]
MEVDIRDVNVKVDVIRFADQEHDSCGQADVLELIFDEVRIFETSNGDYVRINSLEHAKNLIIAINLAIEKEWLA